MAYMTEDKITKWEQKFFGKSLNTNEYLYIAKEYPGYFLLLLHIWNEKKWENDWIWVDQPIKDSDGKPRLDSSGNKMYVGKRTYDELNSKVRARGFDKEKTAYEKMKDEVELNSKQKYDESIRALKKLQEIW